MKIEFLIKRINLENDDSYHHVAFTWEYGSKTSANNEAKIYIDGSNTATNAIGSSNWNDGTGPATIVFSANGVNGGTENNWNGQTNEGIIVDQQDGNLPTGTYFYVLELEPGRKPITGYVYLSK